MCRGGENSQSGKKEKRGILPDLQQLRQGPREARGMIWVGSLGASRYSAGDATAGNGLSQSHPCGPSPGGRAPCCTHTRAHFLPSLFHVHPGARITLQPLPCVLHPEARVASALVAMPGGNASLLLCFWVLDHLAVFTLGIPAVRESLLGKGARTGLRRKGWASCWSDGLTHRAWYSQSPVFSVLSLRGTRLHTGTIPTASRPAGTREPGVSLCSALLCPAG